MMGWHGGSWGWGAWLAMAVTMLVAWTAVVAVVLAMLHARRDAAESEHPARASEAERILAERFARGEIDADEYSRRRALLRSS